MSEKSYLYRRGHWYYFRLHVPNHLAKQLGSDDFRVPLGIKTLSKAAWVTKLLYPFACKLIGQAKGVSVDRAFIMNLIKERIKEILVANEEGIIENAQSPLRHDTENLLQNYDVAMKLLQQCLKLNTFQPIEKYLCDLNERGAGIEINTPDYYWAAHTLSRALLEAFKIGKQRLEGNYDNGYDESLLTAPVQAFNTQAVAEVVVQKIAGAGKDVFGGNAAEPLSRQTVTSSNGLSLDDIKTVIAETVAPLLPPKPEPLPPAPLKPLIDKLCNEQLNAQRWTEHYITEAKAYLGVMVEYFGPDTDVRTITRDQMLELRDKVLKCLPKNRSKLSNLKGLTLRRQLEVPGTEKIGIISVNKYLDLFGRFFRWCLDNKTITEDPSRNLQLKNPEADQAQRKPFTKTELVKIITLLKPGRYTSDTPYGTLERERFWIIMLAMFQGMRENEICQLFIKDIVKVDGVPCINITADNTTAQRTKNAPSRRVIPIHPVLLKLGLLDVANSNRRFCNDDKPSDNRNQLFRTMVYTPRRGYIRTLQVFFSKFKREHITNDRKKAFHSFRHNFDTAMMNLGEPLFIVECLDGHKRQGETAGRYAKPQVEAMLKTLSKLDYGFNVFEILETTPLPDEEIAQQIKQLPVFES